MLTDFIHYTEGQLNRANDERKDKAWVIEKFNQKNSLLLPVWENLNLIKNFHVIKESGSSSIRPQAIMIKKEVVSEVLNLKNEPILLGLYQDQAIFAIDFSSLEKSYIENLINQGMFIDLREVGPHLSSKDAALMAYARGLSYWHRENKYCSRCGNLSNSKEGGSMRLCANKKCEKPVFPRIDPAVIMLVENIKGLSQQRYCLLGRQNVWPQGMYSTLAGFVEPGESLEEAVIREVFEEAGIRVKNIVYKFSQPWPFPSSMMLGFSSEAINTNIKINENELEDVKWFSEKEVRNFGEWGDKTKKLQLPRKDSIARHLIETWLNKPT